MKCRVKLYDKVTPICDRDRTLQIGVVTSIEKITKSILFIDKNKEKIEWNDYFCYVLFKDGVIKRYKDCRLKKVCISKS